jgi:chitin disaccharide deacetylase
MSGQRWLIVTADDFGITQGVNRGIVQAHREGILTSTSLMVDRPACLEAAELARACPELSVGVHLELRRNDNRRLAEEVDRQLGRFVDLVGRGPTHIDSHHDVHHAAQILPHVLARAAAIGAPVRGYSAARHFSKFYGQWGGATHLEQIGVDQLLRMLDDDVGEGVTELNCHPGYVEPGFPSSYTVEREEELRTLCDRRVRLAIVQRKIRLIGFRELPGVVRSPAAASVVRGMGAPAQPS